MATLVTRSGKGSPLTHAEVDANFTNLNTDKLELSGGTMTGNLSFGDNDKAIFGAGSDLQIYHDGSHSYITDQGSGNLYLQASGQLRLQSSTGENYLLGNADGAVNLYYDNAQKFTTTSTGVDITGTLTSDGLTVDGDGSLTTSSGAVLKLENSTTALTTGSVVGDLQFYANDTSTNATGVKAFIKATSETSGGTNIGLTLATSDSTSATGLSRIRIDADGDISFYEDTGTTAKFFWDASAESLELGGDLILDDGVNRITLDSIAGANRLLSTTTGFAAYEDLEFRADNYLFKSGSVERMRIDSSGNVGIGTTTPQSSAGETSLTINGSTTGRLDLRGGGVQAGTISSSGSDMTVQTGYGKPLIIASGTTAYTQFKTNGVERMRIDSSGRVGIGTSSPDTELHVEADTPVFRLTNPQSTSSLGLSMGKIEWETRDSSASGVIAHIDVVDSNNFGTTFDMAFATGQSGSATERMRIDSSGRLLLGTTTAGVGGADEFTVAGSGATGITIRSGTTSTSNLYFADGTSGNAQYRGYVYYNHDTDVLGLGVSAFEAVRIDSSGNVGIGTTSPASKLQVDDANNVRFSFTESGTGHAYLTVRAGYNTKDSQITFSNNTNSTTGSINYDHTSNFMKFSTNGNNERMRIDSSGNLLVGTTDSTPSTNTTGSGIALSSTGTVEVARDGNHAIRLNRMTSDGDIAVFRKGGTTVGSIGVYSTGTRIYLGTGDTGLVFGHDVGTGDTIFPMNPSTNLARDNAIDLGVSGARFDDIHATNGTIQTSDRNEKQDIAELSDAEQRVAVAAKGLLRKFRWKDKVAEKGDKARTHFGIIAQDLQAAFAAEGLDAGDYAMFIHSTWTDEETGEERSRMGVRYSELLAFIIAAI